MPNFDPLIAALPMTLSSAVLGWRGFGRQQQLDQQRRAEDLSIAPRGDVLTPDQVAVLTSDLARLGQLATHLDSSLIIALGGTFGAKEGIRQLEQLALSGLERAVSSVIVAEPDGNARAEFKRRIERINNGVYADRLIYAHPSNKGGGFDGARLEVTLDSSDVWGPKVANGAQRAIYAHLARTQNQFPKLVLAYISMGGSAALLTPAIAEFKQRFDCLVVAVMALPEYVRFRERIPELMAWYEHFGVDLWIPIDNLQLDPTTIDTIVTVVVNGLLEAPQHEAGAIAHLNNVLRLATAEDKRGSVLLLRALSTELASFPYHPAPGGPTRYYSTRERVIEETTVLARRLDEGEGIWSDELPVGQDEAVFDLIVLPLFHRDLLEVSDAQQQGRWTRAHLRHAYEHLYSPNGHSRMYRRSNYAQIFSSLPATIEDPERPIFPILAVRLIAAKNSDELTAELAKVPERRRLTMPLVETLSPPIVTANFSDAREGEAVS